MDVIIGEKGPVSDLRILIKNRINLIKNKNFKEIKLMKE
ncbi:hypothetical protein VV11_021040 [Trichodesmium erythraeum 21-75]|nr:hypothetical protein [Trichodesmium erythraeum 21-75]